MKIKHDSDSCCFLLLWNIPTSSLMWKCCMVCVSIVAPQLLQQPRKVPPKFQKVRDPQTGNVIWVTTMRGGKQITLVSFHCVYSGKVRMLCLFVDAATAAVVEVVVYFLKSNFKIKTGLIFKRQMPLYTFYVL